MDGESVYFCLNWARWASSVHLHHAVDFGDEPEAREEPDGPREKKEDQDHDHGVAEVQDGARCARDLQLGEEVVDGVHEEVHGGEAAGEEGTPLPVIVLCTQVEVAEQDGSFRARDHQDDEDQEEETEHVVHLVGPDAVEDEEELDEDAAEGQDAAHDDAGQRPGVEGLLGDLPGDLVGSHRVLDGIFLEAEVGADESEGHGDAEPQSQDGHQRAEGDGCRGALAPQNQVHDEEVSEHDPRTKK